MAGLGGTLALPLVTMSIFSPIPDTPLTRALRTAAIVVVLLVAAFFLVAATEARRVRVDTKDLASPSVPPRFDGVKVVFVADIHAGPNLGSDRMAALVDQVNSLDADVLILGGDYVGGRRNGAAVFYPKAAKFRAKLGRYAVLGNHDAWEGREDAVAGLEKAGITLLENQTVRIWKDGESIAIGGVEDLYTGHPDAVRIAEEIAPSDFSILVSHNPDVFGGQLSAAGDKWDLALAGHTHGGQVTFFGKFAFMVPSRFGRRFLTGWKHEGGVPILISNGVGTVTAPLRFFAQPEVHVITLKRTDAVAVGGATGTPPAVTR